MGADSRRESHIHSSTVSNAYASAMYNNVIVVNKASTAIFFQVIVVNKLFQRYNSTWGVTAIVL